jgi:predicted anti-sigma-YlaC factor YlaD
MNTRFDPARLSEWLRAIATTEDDEVDCDGLMQAAESLVAAGTRGEDLRLALPHLALHLDHCPDCREWYDTLVAFARADTAS